MNRDDTLWKAILEDIFDDFLLFFIPDAGQLIDFGRGFIFLDKELEQLFPPEADEFSNRSVDKLVQVFLRDGREEWILVHVEVQGYADAQFAERMFTYYARIFDKYHHPITAFAILTDQNKRFRPTEYTRTMLGTSLVYRFNSYKILEQSTADLAASTNPFAAVVLVVQTALQKKKQTEEALLGLKLALAKKLLAKPFSRNKIRQLLNFLRYYVRFDKPDTTAKFDSALAQLTNQQPTMGLEEFLLHRERKAGMEQGLEKGLEQGLEKGLEKGIDRGKAAVVRNMLRQTTFSNEQIADLAEVSIAFVEQIRREL